MSVVIAFPSPNSLKQPVYTQPEPRPLSDLPLCSHIRTIEVFNASDYQRALNAVQNSRDHDQGLTPVFQHSANLTVAVPPSRIIEAVKTIKAFLTGNGMSAFTPAKLSETEILDAFEPGTPERDIMEVAIKAGLYLGRDDIGVYGIPPENYCIR